MKRAEKISLLFPKHLFWDVNIDSLDIERDKAFIIPRALYMTDKATFNKDIEKLETIYSSNQIIRYLKSTKEKISNDVCELVAKRYSIPIFHRF
ncbi:MAG: DUF6922 domain-containing protein [Flavisolibacter sp.]